MLEKIKSRLQHEQQQIDRLYTLAGSSFGFSHQESLRAFRCSEALSSFLSF